MCVWEGGWGRGRESQLLNSLTTCEIQLILYMKIYGYILPKLNITCQEKKQIQAVL